MATVTTLRYKITKQKLFFLLSLAKKAEPEQYIEQQQMDKGDLF